MNIKAGIITIGDELLIGQVVDTNAAWISMKFNEAGVKVINRRTVGDDTKEIISAIEQLRLQCNLVILTGGLGPTSDDKTRDVLCSYFDDDLKLDEEVLNDITSFFVGRGRSVTDRNKDQAYVPVKSKAIRNPNGTAPGIWFNENEFNLFALPGVPHEMKAMLQNFVIPQLRSMHDLKPVIHKSIMTIGLGESFLADMIGGIESKLPSEIGLAYLPGPGMVRLRLSCYEPGLDTEMVMQGISDELVITIGKRHVYSQEDEPIENALSKLLLLNSQTVSVAESCTGGNIAHLFTSVPGSSDWFMGGVVAYTESVKNQLLGIEKDLIDTHGVVSEEVALAMALGARERMNTSWSISTTGVAGPSGGTLEKPVGTVWVAIAGDHGVSAKRFTLLNNRERNIELASMFAINELRLMIEST